jgi:hypothetical protein
MARSRRRTGTRGRVRRYRLKLTDHLMLAGIAGGGLYLILHHALSMPGGISWAFGVIAFGFALGNSLPTPRYRSPIAWRRRR